MNRKHIRYGVFALLILFFFVAYNQIFSASSKLSDKYLTDYDLITKSEYIVSGGDITKNEIINYAGVDFIVFNFLVDTKILGESIEDEIRILQTVVPHDDIFKFLERGKRYVLFLEKYEGPVTENAYVICGVDLGKIELEGSALILNPRQIENFELIQSLDFAAFIHIINQNR